MWAVAQHSSGAEAEEGTRSTPVAPRGPRTVDWAGPDAEVIDQIVVDSKGGPHRPASLARRIPGQAYPRLQQKLCVVLIEAGFTDARIGLDHEVGVIAI